MRAIENAALFYEKAGLNLTKDVDYYLKYGILVCTPDYFLLAREAECENVQKFCAYGQGDTWFIHFATGINSMKSFLSLAPRMLPFLAWYREKDHANGRERELHLYRTERFIRRLSV